MEGFPFEGTARTGGTRGCDGPGSVSAIRSRAMENVSGVDSGLSSTTVRTGELAAPEPRVQGLVPMPVIPTLDAALRKAQVVPATAMGQHVACAASSVPERESDTAALVGVPETSSAGSLCRCPDVALSAPVTQVRSEPMKLAPGLGTGLRTSG